mmetsp:Transcript_19122/g.43460  ORF Transcript_19122/g.43460 Transcript_19122/m.43460 type:complete len:515 (-) Transcript_19122:91-1635(-)
MAQHWEVVGGSGGGITVRSEKSVASKQLDEKLATGSIVEELELAGERLHYRKVTGAGPETGWVSVSLKDKILLNKVAKPATPAAAAKAAPAAAAPSTPVAKAAGAPAAASSAAPEDVLTQEVAPPPAAIAGAPVYDLTKEQMAALAKEADDWWMDSNRRKVLPPDTSILKDFCADKAEVGLEPPRDYKGGQLPVMPRTVGLPTYAAVPDDVKKNFPERPVRRPMIRLYCFPGAADNYMLWIQMATAAPEWCEVAIYEPRAHGFRPNEPWDKSLEERADDAFKVMRPAFETHARGGVSEGAPFAFLSHGVGGQFMALLAHRLKRELSIEPLVVFSNDGPPPNTSTLSTEGYKLLCTDPFKFYQSFQQDTVNQIQRIGGKDSKAGQALLQKWSRGLRLFEEHALRCQALDDPIYHKFNCDLHVLVAKHTLLLDEVIDQMGNPQLKKDMAARAKMTAARDSSSNWDKKQFEMWQLWTEEDFVYHELECDHGQIKNARLMQDVVFKELASFCGMDYRP